MRDFRKITLKVLKKNAILISLFFVLLFSFCYLRFSVQNVSASPEIAQICMKTCLCENNEFYTLQEKSFSLSQTQSSSVDISAKDVITLNVNSSLFYIFEISNISNSDELVCLKYDKIYSSNFKVTYLVNGAELDLDIVSISINTNEDIKVMVHIFVEDLSLDSKIKGSLNLTVYSM